MRAALLTVVLTCGAAPALAGGCAPDQVDLRGDWGSATFTVEVADDPGERNIGLMNRPSMARSAGMLFVSEHPQPVAFWMKNTLIPLDMLFFDETGTLEKVHANAIPHDETGIPGGGNIQYVLEINGGLAGRLGIEAGTEMRNPAIAPDLASWPCD